MHDGLSLMLVQALWLLCTAGFGWMLIVSIRRFYVPLALLSGFFFLLFLMMTVWSVVTPPV
jgi:hypothetical protein